MALSFGSPEPPLCNPLPDIGLPGITPGNQVALTFDDGPDQWTEEILDTLEDYGAKATFFVIGNKLHAGDKVLRRMVAEGHEVGNHTFTHANLSELSNHEVCHELADCSSAIYAATGKTPYFYRAPFLKDPPAAKMAGLTLGMYPVDADVIGEDWNHDDFRAVTTRVVRGIKNGGRIVLLHDGVPSDRLGSRRQTVKAVKALLPWLLEHDYELVTVSQLVGRVDVSEQSRAGASA